MNKHNTTMTSIQRKELIRILSTGPFTDNTISIKDLAEKTDVELHELWLIECEYENPYK